MPNRQDVSELGKNKLLERGRYPSNRRTKIFCFSRSSPQSTSRVPSCPPTRCSLPLSGPSSLLGQQGGQLPVIFPDFPPFDSSANSAHVDLVPPAQEFQSHRGRGNPRNSANDTQHHEDSAGRDIPEKSKLGGKDLCYEW